MKPRDLARLKALSDMVFEAELAEIRRNRSEASALETQVDRIHDARRARADETRALAAPDPAQRASADLHWDRWTSEHLHRLQASRARLEAEAETLRGTARRAFGRGLAVDALQERLAKERSRREARRRGE